MIIKKYFKTGNIDCKSSKTFFISSFAGEIQNNILTGISVGKFLKKDIKYFINYGEFTLI